MDDLKNSTYHIDENQTTERDQETMVGECISLHTKQQQNDTRNTVKQNQRIQKYTK